MGQGAKKRIHRDTFSVYYLLDTWFTGCEDREKKESGKYSHRETHTDTKTLTVAFSLQVSLYLLQYNWLSTWVNVIIFVEAEAGKKRTEIKELPAIECTLLLSLRVKSISGAKEIEREKERERESLSAVMHSVTVNSIVRNAL